MFKPREIEELVDYYIFRRMAAWLVPTLARLRLTPNQVSFLGLLTGLAAAWCFAHRCFFTGGLLLWLTVVIDCCDGQLARLTGQTSEEGRLIDGIFDHIWVAFIWTYIAFSGQLYQPIGPISFTAMVWLEALAGISIILHCGIHVTVKTRYLQLAFPEYGEKELNRSEAIALLKKHWHAKRIHFVAIYALVTAHMFLFGSHKQQGALPPFSPQQRETLRKRLYLPMRLLSWTGEGTHHAIMIFFALLTPLYPAAMLITFWIVLVPMNLWWFWGLWLYTTRKQETMHRFANISMSAGASAPN